MTTMVDEDLYRSRVMAGVEWLDETVPDWVERIDLGKFVFIDPDSCVLGQLFAQEARAYDIPGDLHPDDYTTDDDWRRTGYGMICTLFSTWWAVQHGFGGGCSATYRRLWTEIIEDARAA